MSHDQAGVEQKTTVRIHIDQKPYESPNPTTGEALYGLGKIPAHHELYREVNGDKEDQPIPSGPEPVHLKKDEHFHTGPKEITIIVNGQKKTVTTRHLSFAEVVALAFNPVPTGDSVLLTVTYYNGPHRNTQGILCAGGNVKIKEGMVFNVTATNKS